MAFFQGMNTIRVRAWCSRVLGRSITTQDSTDTFFEALDALTDRLEAVEARLKEDSDE